MLKEPQYTSSIKDMPLMFSEMKRTALLLCENKNTDEIVRLSMEKNIYQLDKEKRRRDVPLRMIKRLQTINQPLLEVIAHGRDDEARLISFLALMKVDRLLFEYMYEVYADRFHAGFDEITDKDFLDFIERKAQNSAVVAKWSVSNLASVRSKIKSALCDAKLAKRNGNALLIQRPIIDDTFRVLFDETDKVYIKAMLMEV
ncbi:DUF1819 family protein [Pygmaiobacter massiliensis]|uniref:DUF1819 family protein n=1 Tax=Pygmaiobacter massiliensis TaxID=1917873 RepID=UPI00289C8CE2|nr:DUF1819 family protein [Pygmaiobacter massiliensis]